MAGDTKIYEDRELEIYRQYQNVIAPFIVDLEVRDGEYPIEIFNEIRATFTHISRYKVQNSTDDLISAERHIKRATLDCYKYLCVSHAEEIKAFRYNYRSVDLHLADNGRFLNTLDSLEKQAKASYIDAKKAEVSRELSDERIYSMFENAYNKHCDMLSYLHESEESIRFASTQTRKRNFWTVFSVIITVISIVVALIGWVR